MASASGIEKPPILVAGESLVDIVAHSDGTTTELPGGSPANVADAMARLGSRVQLLTAYADDRLGALVTSYLEDSAVQLAADPHILSRTSSAVATLDASGAASYSFDIAGDLPQPPPGVSPLHFHFGSLGAVLRPGADLIATMVETLTPTTTLSFDINARPSAVPLDADVVGRIESLVSGSDLVKASDEDLAALRPDDSVDDAATHLLALGAAVVVVTLGRDGARCYTADEVAAVPGETVTVRDTIGAGDAFCAALLDTLRARDLLGADRRADLPSVPRHEWQQVLQRANRAAAITVSRQGANPPTAEELSNLQLK